MPGADGSPTRIAGETRRTRDTLYRLRDTVVVEPGAKLKIEAGAWRETPHRGLPLPHGPWRAVGSASDADSPSLSVRD